MKTATRICVARHGETDWNNLQILQGWMDVPLNDKGMRQAHELAEMLVGAHFARVYTSPLRRASRTAEIVAVRLGLGRPAVHEGLKERNFGVVQGKPKAELAETHPEVLQEIANRNPAYQFEQGESPDGFADRVLDAIKDIGRHNVGNRVLVITHGWVMDVITRHVRHLPRTAMLNMKRKNIEQIWLEVRAGATIASIAGADGG